MQGTAADIIKRAMIAVDAWCQRKTCRRGSSCRCTTSWCSRCARTPSQTVTAALHERMDTAAELKVPLKIEVGVGANWDEAH